MELAAIALVTWSVYPVQVQVVESLQTKESLPPMKRRESRRRERSSLAKVYLWITSSLLLKVVTLRLLKRLLLRNILPPSKQWCKARSKSSTKSLKKKKVKVKTSCRTGWVIAQARATSRGIKTSLTRSTKNKMATKTMPSRLWTRTNLKDLRGKLSSQRNSWSNCFKMLTSCLQSSKLNCSIF